MRVALRAASRDVSNRLRYGAEAPKYGERIWVDVSEGMLCCGKGKLLRGKVVHEWPPAPVEEVIRVADAEPIRSCILHWRHGVPWEKTSVFSRMQAAIATHGRTDGCATMDDVTRRYCALDRVFCEVSNEGRIKTVREYGGGLFREIGGMNFHIGPGGEAFFGRLGQHRLAMALVLGIRRVPAELGAIYVGALPFLAAFRDGARPQRC